MRIREFVTEASRGEKERARRAAADAQRRAEAERKAAADAQMQAQLAKRGQKKMAVVDPSAKAAVRGSAQLNKPAAKTQEPQPSGWMSDPRLQKYYVDPSIDTTFEGGYYINFVTDYDAFSDPPRPATVIAYWSRNPDVGLEGATRYGQVAKFPLKDGFKVEQFQALIDTLVRKSSTRSQPGYVHIIVPQALQRGNWMQYWGGPLITFLAREYPNDEDQPTVNASVGWETL